ncbi:MAG TPA: FAD-dependent monooxygenase [Gaiellales bacterium]|jgi:salicylate hydroxylase
MIERRTYALTAAGLKVIVAGAGLGGLSAAIGLRRSGHRVVVLEQADALGTVGAGIQIAPNAARLLDRLGVIDHLRPTGVPAEAAIRRRWSDGSVIGEVTLGDQVLRQFGASYWCALRSDVHAALVETATEQAGDGPPVEIVLGARVTGVSTSGPDRATVTIEGGREQSGDVVIGADGIRSPVRDSLFGALPPTFSGRVTNRHLLDASRYEDDAELAELFSRPAQNIWIGPGGHVITHPISSCTGIYMGVTTAGIPDDQAFWSAAVDKDTLLERFAAWDPRVVRLIAAAPPATGYGLHDSTPMDTWSTGRVALLGDACHPMLPFQAQGAAQAVEDGAVLAGVLDGVAPDDVSAALARYVSLRMPRASRVQAASRANGALWHLDDGPAQVARDAELASGAADFTSYQWLWSSNPDGTPLEG